MQSNRRGEAELLHNYNQLLYDSYMKEVVRCKLYVLRLKFLVLSCR